MGGFATISKIKLSDHDLERGLTIKSRGEQANLPYVLWIAAFNTSFLCAYLILNTWASNVSPKGKSNAPVIFEMINKNGLIVFLIVSSSLSSSRLSFRPKYSGTDDALYGIQANLLTGLVNISIESMYASDSFALIVLLGYCAIIFLIAWGLRNKRLRM
jgi:phosphatidylinositol glycan class W